ncbi:MAG: diaminopimelate epimerase [Armatimonadota bacterium]
MELQFTKMQGIGNDFVVADCLVPDAPTEEALQAASVFLCDRKFGVGGDGVVLVLPSSVADFKMRMFNPDGTEAEMCGNGIRCFAKFIRDRGYSDKTDITAETLAGILTLTVTDSDSTETLVRVDMGEPILQRADIPMLGEVGSAINETIEVSGEKVAITAVSMGNPHVAFFEDTATDERIGHLGPLMEKHSLFPRKTNVHLIAVISPSEIKMLTWERGAGRTLACGTGACASVVASALNKRTGRSVLAHLPGGDLHIEWSEKDNHVYMTGPATEVFTGTVTVKNS